MIAIVLLVLIVVLIAWAVAMYNRLVSLRNRYKNAFSQIDVQLKRRYDLIPNLVETAKGYMKHERETLEAVIAARNQAVSAAEAAAGQTPGDPERDEAAAAGAEGALHRRPRPALRAGRGLPRSQGQPDHGGAQEELTSTENRVAFSRQAFNDSVMGYNTARETFPTTIIASSMGFAAGAAARSHHPARGARAGPSVSFTS